MGESLAATVEGLITHSPWLALLTVWVGGVLTAANPCVLAMIPLLAIQQGIAVGFGLILGTVNVFFRDVGQAVGVALQFWFWLTPIVYPISVLPEEIKDLVLTWNPMAPFVVAYQNIILLGEWPNWIDFLPHLIGAVSVLAAGYFVFVKLSGEMVDEL